MQNTFLRVFLVSLLTCAVFAQTTEKSLMGFSVENSAIRLAHANSFYTLAARIIVGTAIHFPSVRG